MMKFFCLFLLSALALAFQPTGALADQRMALVMGNSAYQRAPKLANATNDADLLEARKAMQEPAGFTSLLAR
ncbi:hypothetical protein ACVIWV_005662 [Bradyrhizobium diazoefficiens]|uniref:Uncharacterized protein n=2 Tax=Nitrobacteraceae TaxID=41294 RepID=A0A0E4BT05_9BRAD|nr:caspase family protein [Bradyrhizobium diazoefficiens]WLA63830.1 caspase family protein [Bradyrhizobium diazoefficiens]BAR59251.1 hypothetical protein NK6_6097 [Bradyrhizobium diazoefficiens]